MWYVLQDMGRRELGVTQLNAQTERDALHVFARMRRLCDGEFVAVFTIDEWDTGMLGRIYELHLEPARLEARRQDGKSTDGA